MPGPWYEPPPFLSLCNPFWFAHDSTAENSPRIKKSASDRYFLADTLP